MTSGVAGERETKPRAAPDSNALGRPFRRISQAIDFLAKAGFILGGGFAAFEYVSAQEDVRIGRTSDYIQRYEEGEVADARRSINEMLRPYQAQFQELEAANAVSTEVKRDLVESIIESSQRTATDDLIDEAIDPKRRAGGDGTSDFDRRVLLRRLIASTPKAPVEDNIDRVVDFYEGLRTCVREELCERRVALAYFSRAEAPEFWNNFWPYIERRQQNNPIYAEGLEWFARSEKRVGRR